MIQWTQDLATGIERIDEQHRELYARIDALHDAMRAGRLEEVPAVLEYLGRYATEHFATEEAHMAAEGYPGLELHRAAHLAFVAEFERQRAACQASRHARPVVELSGWLADWLRDHVRRVDGELARFLRAAPRGPP